MGSTPGVGARARTYPLPTHDPSHGAKVSKASEYAARYPEAWSDPGTERERINDTVFASVTNDGRCALSAMGGSALSPERALSLARWILETFNE